MANPNTGEVGQLFKDYLGRYPTNEEMSQWTSISHNSPQWTNRVQVISSLPESQQFKSTGKSTVQREKEARTGETVNLGTTGTPGLQTAQNPYTITPSGSTPTTGDNRTFSTGYTPITDANGNVSSFIPAGMSYTPNQYANYTPAATTGVNQAFPASSTVSGVNVPTSATEGAYSGIPLNNTSLGSMTIGGGIGEGGVAFPSFTYNFAQEQADAYARLKPFYEKLLSFAGGRLDLAQRILEYTYQQGMRESRQEYEQSAKEQALTFPQEQESMKTQQNQRGIMTSGFGKTEQGRLGESQNLRREAIERALENRESRLVSQRGFGLEEKQKGFEEEKFGQERERRNEASDLAEKKFSIKQAEYQSSLDKALRAEQKAIREQEHAFQYDLAKKSATGGFT